MRTDKPMKLVPKLRFPEFQDGDEWVVERLGSICNLYQPKPLSASAMQQDGPYIVYGANGVIGRHNRYNHKDCKVIVGCRGTCGEVHRTHPRSWITNNAMVVESKDNRIDENFIFYSLESTDLSSLVTGGAQPQITCTGFSPFSFVFPECSHEQQKVADCLGSLDDLITAESRKLEALRQHKQGLMQQLFPLPGETVPRLRFPEFRIGAEWNMRTLSSATDVNPPSKGLPNSFIYIDLESVKDSMLIDRKETTREAAPSRAQRCLKYKDIIYQTVRPYQRNNLFFDINDGYEYVASTGYAQLRAHDCPEFLYQLLHTDSFVNSVLARCTGSNYPAINPSVLASIDVALPGRKEQLKIANCLGVMDDWIAETNKNLGALRQHKQGLMQQLFPSLENH